MYWDEGGDDFEVGRREGPRRSRRGGKALQARNRRRAGEEKAYVETQGSSSPSFDSQSNKVSTVVDAFLILPSSLLVVPSFHLVVPTSRPFGTTFFPRTSSPSSSYLSLSHPTIHGDPQPDGATLSAISSLSTSSSFLRPRSTSSCRPSSSLRSQSPSNRTSSVHLLRKSKLSPVHPSSSHASTYILVLRFVLGRSLRNFVDAPFTRSRRVGEQFETRLAFEDIDLVSIRSSKNFLETTRLGVEAFEPLVDFETRRGRRGSQATIGIKMGRRARSRWIRLRWKRRNHREERQRVDAQGKVVVDPEAGVAER